MGVKGTSLVAGFHMWPENTYLISHETLPVKDFRLQMGLSKRHD